MVVWANESTSKFQTNRLSPKIAWHGFVWDFQTNRVVSFVELWVDDDGLCCEELGRSRYIVCKSLAQGVFTFELARILVGTRDNP